MKGDLFYSVNEQLLFWIPNYYTHGTGKLDNLIKNLNEGKKVIQKFIPKAEVSCDEITTSSRYKYMWYFSAKCEKPPKEAFILDGAWTMYKWIRN